MKWKDEYSLGIPEIDDQHKQLFRSFSDIDKAIKLNQGWSNTYYALTQMIQVVHMHFYFEEAIMRMFGFPGLKAHKREHQIFFDKLNNLEKCALNTSVDAEISHFLTDWLKEHVLVSDRGYVTHIFSGSHVVIPEFNPI